MPLNGVVGDRDEGLTKTFVHTAINGRFWPSRKPDIDTAIGVLRDEPLLCPPIVRALAVWTFAASLTMQSRLLRACPDRAAATSMRAWANDCEDPGHRKFSAFRGGASASCAVGVIRPPSAR